MKIRLRAKAGGGLSVTDENGNAIENLIDAAIEHCKLGEVPVVHLAIRAEVVIDSAGATVEVVQPEAASVVERNADEDHAE